MSVCVARSAAGLLVCDTRSSHRQADEIRADLHPDGPEFPDGAVEARA